MKLRRVLLMTTCVLSLSVGPARAGLFDSIFGGGGGGGCAGAGGLFNDLLDAIPGGSSVNKVADSVTGTVDKVGNAVGGNVAVPGGGSFGGCPVVESFPGAVEIQTIKTAVESVLQTIELFKHTEQQTRMLARGHFSVLDSIVAKITRIFGIFGAESLPWSEPAVRPAFEQVYPEETPIFTSPDDYRVAQEEHERIAREASIQSKRVSAALVEDINTLTATLRQLEAARATCLGQTCLGDINSQIGLVSAELNAKASLLDAAHNRAAELESDNERELRKLSDAEHNRAMKLNGGM